MHVCILGAGIVGLAAAYELRQAGHEVTVVDRAPHGGLGTSLGNGAQLSYSYVQPLADPAIWKQLPKLLLESDSPLKFRLQADPQQWRWGLAFLAACNGGRSLQSTRELLALAAASRLAFEAMQAVVQPACDFLMPGKLVLYPGAAGVEAARRQLEAQAQLGSAPQRIVTTDETIAIEPALAGYRPQIAGAVFTPSECVADCHQVCLALEAWLRAQGVRFVMGAEIRALRREGQRIVAVSTAQGDLQADQYLVALGTGSVGLCAPLGVRVPVYPLKGYSLTLDVSQAPDLAPTVSITDSARKVVFARLGQRLRVAGMVELVGHGLDIPADRIESLRRSTEAVFPGCDTGGDVSPWTGLRPATPTGVPSAERAGASNLWLNTGHGALGFTLAFGTAKALLGQMEAAA
ncbi:MAG: D-amino acid dehydrogenase [Comamonas sp.]